MEKETMNEADKRDSSPPSEAADGLVEPQESLPAVQLTYLPDILRSAVSRMGWSEPTSLW